MHDPHPHYFKSHANERMWLDDSVSKISAYKLNPIFNYKFYLTQNKLIEIWLKYENNFNTLTI